MNREILSIFVKVCIHPFSLSIHNPRPHTLFYRVLASLVYNLNLDASIPRVGCQMQSVHRILKRIDVSD